MAAWALLALAIAGGPQLIPESGTSAAFATPSAEPKLELSRKFALPVAEYRAPDGTWKHGNGIIVGRDISPGTTVGIGFFRMKPKSQEGLSSPPVRKSHKVSLGFSMQF